MSGLKIVLTDEQTKEAVQRYVRSLFKDTIKVRVASVEVYRGEATVVLK